MRGKRCPYCEKFLTINPRVRKRRKTCGSSSCQRALNKENSARWRREHPDSCDPDYPRVKVWLQKHPGYLQRYRETHPAYVEKNREAKRRRYRKKRLRVDIQNVIGLQPLEMTFFFSTFPCLDMQNSLGKNLCMKDNGIIETRR